MRWLLHPRSIAIVIIVSAIFGVAYGGRRVYESVRPESLLIRNDTQRDVHVGIVPDDICESITIPPGDEGRLRSGWWFCREDEIQITAFSVSPRGLTCDWGEAKAHEPLTISATPPPCTTATWEPWGFTCEDVEAFIPPEDCFLPTRTATP